MKYYQTFIVAGEGDFPFDMLRYDTCWPSAHEDVNSLADERDGATRIVRLSRHVVFMDQKPTSGRWESFGWRVSAISTRKLSA